MECPVCDKDFSHMSYEEQMHHVNQCLDLDENISQAANKLAEHKFDACPICFKKAQCHIEHLKKCAKQQSVFPKDLINIIQRYEKETGNRLKGRKKRSVAVKAVATGREQLKRNKKEKGEDAEEVIPKKKVQNDGIQSLHFTKTVTVKNGRLTTCTDLPDRKEIQEKLDRLLNGSVIVNVCNKNSPSEVAAMFSLSSLLRPHPFVARGFEKLVAKPNVDRPSAQPPVTAADAGFLPQVNVIQIDQTNQFLERLWQQKDKKSADLLIKTREQTEVACHSLLWCMNTGKPHMTRCGSMFRVDCSAFSKTVVEKFVAFCYSGRMRIEAEMECDVRSFCRRFECEHLLK